MYFWLYRGLVGVVLGEGDWFRRDRKKTGFTLYSHVREGQSSSNIVSVDYFAIFCSLLVYLHILLTVIALDSL